jgi:uncharacterized phage protein (TIGR02220 family)
VAGDWLKIECGTPDKPEVFEIASALKISLPEAFGRLFLVWRLFDQRTEDGNAPSVTSAYIDFVAGVPGFSEAMRKVGWLAGGEDGKAGISLPEFDHHNGKTAKSRVLTARRVATHKTRSGNADGNGTLTHTALPREEKRREVNTMSGKPDAPKPNGKLHADAVEILGVLNATAGRNYKPVKANLEMIEARLKEGATPDEIKAVIRKKCSQWGSDEKMAEYLRPATLFNRTKFAQYQGELGFSGSDWREGLI